MKTLNLDFSYGGIARHCLLNLPDDYDAAQNQIYKLVLGCHGGMHTAAGFEQQTLLAAKGTARGFIVAEPQGTTGPLSPGHYTFNSGGCCGFAYKRGVDDPGYLEEIVRQIRAAYKISLAFMTGFSNGANLCYRIAAINPGLFSSYAPVSGSTVQGYALPDVSVDIDHHHGYRDQHCPFEGGKGTQAMEPCLYIKVPDVLQRVMNSNIRLSAYAGHGWPGCAVDPLQGAGGLIANYDATKVILDHFDSIPVAA
jgi:poly(3-hydroxybutyrate) depolymerase